MSADVLPVLLCILANLDIPISLHNYDVLLGSLVDDYLRLAVEILYFVIAVVNRWGVNLYYCDVE